MKMKNVYELIESSESEKKTEMVDFLKDFVKTTGETEAKARTLEADAEQWKDLDISSLKTASEFLEKNGGAEAVLKAVAKAEGYEDNNALLEQKQKEYNELEAKQKGIAETWQAEKDLLLLKADVRPRFDDLNSPDIMLDYAIANGFIVKNETGICTNVDGVVTPIETGGFDKLKEHSKFKGSVKLPSGGDIGGGVNGGNTANNSGNGDLESLFK